MKRLLCSLIAVIVSLTCFTACSDNALSEDQVRRIVQEELQKSASKENAFTPGETVFCPLGKTFELPVSFDDELLNVKYRKKSMTVTEMTVKAVRAGDPANRDDYSGNLFMPYIYQATVHGHVDDLFAGRQVWFSLNCDNLIFHIDGDMDVQIAQDGTFSYDYTFGTMSVLQCTIPSFSISAH